VNPDGKETNYGLSADVATECAFLAHVATAITMEELDWKESKMEMESKAKGETGNE